MFVCFSVTTTDKKKNRDLKIVLLSENAKTQIYFKILMTCTAAKSKCFGDKSLPAQQQPNILIYLCFFLFGRGCCLSSNRPENYLSWLKIIFRLRTDLSHRNQLFVYINLKDI